MERLTTVSRLRHTTYVDNLHSVAIRLCLNRFDHILGSCYIHLDDALWLVVGTRRDHTSDVQHIVSTRCAF